MNNKIESIEERKDTGKEITHLDQIENAYNELQDVIEKVKENMNSLIKEVTGEIPEGLKDDDDSEMVYLPEL